MSTSVLALWKLVLILGSIGQEVKKKAADFIWADIARDDVIMK